MAVNKQNIALSACQQLSQAHRVASSATCMSGDCLEAKFRLVDVDNFLSSRTVETIVDFPSLHKSTCSGDFHVWMVTVNQNVTFCACQRQGLVNSPLQSRGF